MLWLVYFESAYYCGYGSHCVVKAESAAVAEELAQEYADTYYHEEDREQYAEENGDDAADEQSHWADVQTVEKFTEAHDSWKYFIDPVQSQFFPKIN